MGDGPAAARIGIGAAWAVALLEAVYLVVLGLGLAARPSAAAPIGDPHFTLMELLILALVAPIVLLFAAVEGVAPPARKPWGRAALVFAGLAAGLTAAVHFSILTLSRHPAFAEFDAVFAFAWPSVVYALDILAWDVFFALAALFAALALPPGPPWRVACRALVASGALSAAGLAGAATGEMALRNVGILGYAVVFPVAALLLARAMGRGAGG